MLLPVLCLCVQMLALAAQEQLRNVSFYPVRYSPASPVIDGKLDDPCWRGIKPYNSYYEYFKSNPKPGKLQTEFRMLYNAGGLYLAIVNYEPNPQNLRKDIADKDNPELWTNDCAELYFDHFADGVGFYKFTVNAIGTMGDMRRLDPAVSLPEWNGNAWTVKTSILPDRWIIEAYFPWEDLGKIAKSGDTWMFCHARYAYTSGRFIGVTSSPEGNYASTDKFGYLYFCAPDEEMSTEKLGQLLVRMITPPWAIQSGDTVIYDAGDGVKNSSIADLLQARRREYDDMSGQLAGMLKNTPLAKQKNQFEKLNQRFAALRSGSDVSLTDYQEYNAICQALKILKYQTLLEQRFNL